MTILIVSLRLGKRHILYRYFDRICDKMIDLLLFQIDEKKSNPAPTAVSISIIKYYQIYHVQYMNSLKRFTHNIV